MQSNNMFDPIEFIALQPDRRAGFVGRPHRRPAKAIAGRSIEVVDSMATPSSSRHTNWSSFEALAVETKLSANSLVRVEREAHLQAHLAFLPDSLFAILRIADLGNHPSLSFV
jgi:hypothetical protein